MERAGSPVAEVVVALDVASVEGALRLVDQLPGLRWAKVGPMLFVRDGPALVRELRGREIQVFLDLKWHDIPHAVAEAVRAAAELGVGLASVHAIGGRRMLEAAVAASAGVRLAAVSVLTSHDEAEYREAVGGEMAGDDGIAAEVLRLVRLAVSAGVDAVVASPHEVAAVRALVGPDRWIVVPGIRPSGVPDGDQRRTAGPAAVAAAGATHLVVGRAITRAERPGEVYQRLCASVS